LSLLQTVFAVAALLDQAEIEFLIGGSLASSVWGQDRTTRDADIAAFIAPSQLDKLEPLVVWPLVLDSELRSSLDLEGEFRSGQILHGETLDKIDLFLLSTAYDRTQMSRRRFIEVSPGHSLPFASAEDTVITKLRWYVLGNRVSDRQWNDIVQVLEIQHGNLDEAYLAQWAEHFGVLDLLREAQSQIVI